MEAVIGTFVTISLAIAFWAVVIRLSWKAMQKKKNGRNMDA